ncbi:MtrB/PioB family decaheme-associated outer membrane protein [Shewanella aestuarii]|uniref:MtrB/PioB family decaheme-associated outer membrane protein n=1 Tax=Shewanella aestuarii TaxID=1028752 RepID=A0A6G9QJ11_9GAMM|nr:MtrB/PioB family decaheme-associated outer membrane protein [Shewanella aestuarii]QIR14123.1 MtrB/PioB family decaheme-associated outer membrane protein [Shewanella aestuarii]
MKHKLNIITLALLANTSFAVMANGYGLANANTNSVKLDKWVCKGCVVETGTTGSVTVGVGYNSEDDIKSANAFKSANEFAGKLDANINYKGENGYQSKVDITDLGMDNARADINVGKLGTYNLNVNYRSIATYKSNTALTPYQGIGGNDLTLPDNWVTAGSSSQMPMLYSSLNPFELSLERERAGLGFEYQAESMFTGFVNYQREDKTGTKQTSGSFFNQSMMLAEPVDYTTDTLEAGIKLKGDNWFTSLNYNGSSFKNQNNQLSYDNAFNPTFGAQTRGYMSLDPDNEAHTISLMGQYNDSVSVVSGRLMLGKMSQDQDFVTSGYGYQLPADSLDASVDLTGMNIKAVSRVNRKVRLNGSYDYNDRKNNTQVEEWTQISINDVTGKVAYNTPYDHTSHRAKLGADYRISHGLKLDAGYDFKRDERSYQDRETTDENTVWARIRVNNFDKWDMWFKGSYGQRDGSDYQASEWTSKEQNQLLRKYYLADRNRSQIEARVSYVPMDALTIDFGARYALDDYKNTEIGLTESKDTSYDANVSYMFNDDVMLNAFYNHQTIDSAQSGSSNFTTATWQADIEDKVDVVGAGLSYNNLMDSRLQLGLDYTYSNSDSTTQVRQGITGDYGDYFAKVHNLNAYALYKATEKMDLRFDYKMENYLDNDAANDIAPDGIWNVVGFGSNSHDYTAHMIMLSMSYKL